jgi:hypothetical protein
MGGAFWNSYVGIGVLKVGDLVESIWRYVPHFVRGVQLGGEEFQVSLGRDHSRQAIAAMPNF